MANYIKFIPNKYFDYGVYITSGAIRNNIRNFWQATPKDVFLSIGLGDGPPVDDAGDVPVDE